MGTNYTLLLIKSTLNLPYYYWLLIIVCTVFNLVFFYGLHTFFPPKSESKTEETTDEKQE